MDKMRRGKEWREEKRGEQENRKGGEKGEEERTEREKKEEQGKRKGGEKGEEERREENRKKGKSRKEERR
jgi:hypothetical protein